MLTEPQFVKIYRWQYGVAVQDDGPRQPLREEPLRRSLVDGGLWTSVKVVPETGSTNADLAELARSGTAEGAVLVAEFQQAGRGRTGRQWTSPPGAGIAASALLRPGSVPTGRWGWLPLLAGVALVETIDAVGGVPATLKWPNDVLIAQRKCAGILTEVVGDAVVLGMGVNVTLRADELPPVAGAQPATSLALAGARGTDREELLVHLLAGVARWYTAWRNAGGHADRCGLRDAYLTASATIGQPVRALLPGGGEVTGEAATVDADGRLEVRGSAGDSRTVAAGDIVHLRPAD